MEKVRVWARGGELCRLCSTWQFCFWSRWLKRSRNWRRRQPCIDHGGRAATKLFWRWQKRCVFAVDWSLQQAGKMITKMFCVPFLSRNLCGTVTLKPSREKSSGWKSCGGHSKWSAMNWTRRSGAWAALLTRALQRPPSLGLTPRLHHPQTLCWILVAPLSRTLPRAPNPATVTSS